jgi:hypothetical protein
MGTAAPSILQQPASTRTVAVVGKWRIALGAVLVLHGLAHANAGIWAANAAPLWLVTTLWGVAMVGYLAAGFGLLRVPIVRKFWRPLMTAAMGASIALLTIVGGAVVFAGVLVDVVVLTVLVHWARPDAGESAWRGIQLDDGAERTRAPHRIAKTFAFLFLLYAVIVTAMRPVYQTWGTTAFERGMTLPGDAFGPAARYRVDHGVTIRAPADSVWPWLVQLGQDRGGFYSYDWLERLFGDDVHNADRVHPEWQRLGVGDCIRAAQPDYLWGKLGDLGWRVSEIVPRRALVLENWGAFVLQPVDSATTRFFVRTRGDGRPTLAGVLLGPVGIFVFEPAHFIMQRAMMLGIRDRAERMMAMSGGVILD